MPGNPALVTQIITAADDTAIPVNASQLSGANVRLLQFLGDYGGFTVNYEARPAP